MTSKYSDRLGRCGCAVLALGLGASSVLGGGVAPSAYFSVEGDINAVGDQYNFNVGLTRSVSSAEDLRFVTWQSGGGTNAAGDPISFGGIDSFLELFDSLNNSRGLNDDHVTLDSLLTWAPIQTRGIALNPDPLVSGNYRLNLQEFSNNQTGPFAVDLIGPDDALVFTGGTPVNGATLDSLKFGSNGGGNAVYNHSAGTFSLLGQLVVAQTGNAVLNLSAGTISAAGLTTVKAGGAVNQTGGTFNANGSLTVDGGSYIRSAGTYSNPGILTVQNGGLFQWDGASNLFNVNLGASVQVTGTGSTLRRRDPSPLADNTFYIQNNTPYNVTLGGKLDADYLWLRLGTVNVDGAGSVLDMSGGDDVFFNHQIGNSPGVSTLTLSNDASGTFNSALATTLLLGVGGGSTGNVNVLSGADLTLQSLDMDESGTSTLTVDGAGSTITQTAGSALTVGSGSGSTGTINVQSSGVFNASHTGAISIKATGSLNVDGGTFRANAPNVTSQTGGTVNTSGTISINGSGVFALNGGVSGSSVCCGGSPAGGNGGSLNANGGTIDLSGTGQLRLLGGEGAVGADSGSGGTLTINGAAVTLVDTSKIRMDGAVGGFQRLADFRLGNGGAGGGVTVTTGSLSLDDSTTLSMNGGNGANKFFSGTSNNGHGGAGGILTVNGGQVTVNNNAVANLIGGNGGTGANSANGGAGGQLLISAGSMTVNGGQVTLRRGTGSATGVNGANALIDITGGTFTMNGGEVFTNTFQRSGAGVFGFNDGKLTVSGGSFDPGVAFFNIDGAAAAQRPTLVLTDGATNVGVTQIRIGDNNRGRMELLNGTTQTLSSTTSIGYQSTGDGQVLVDASTWMISGVNSDLAVGEGGMGELTVSNNGVVSVSDDFIAGRGGSTTGIVNLDSGSSLTVGNRLIVGEAGAGSVIVSTGSSATSTNAVNIGWLSGSDGSLVVDGFGSVLNANTNLNVGGHNGGAGGTGLLSVTDSAAVNVTNTLRVYGGGTVDLSGGMLTADTIDHTHGGAFNFTGGTLHVDTFNGTLDQNGGTLAPGSSPGKTVIGSDYNQNSGVLEIELGGTVQTSEYDFVEVLGLASLNGDLVVSAINGFNPTYGDSFDLLMAWGGLIDAFNSVSFPANPTNSAWSLTNDGNFLRLSLDSTLAGDLDNDGFVGIGDLNLVLSAWNQTVPPANAAADPSGDGFVGIADLNIVLGNWNTGTPPASATPIPEPASFLLLAGMGLFAQRRR